MRLFVIYLNISVCFCQPNMKKLTIYYMGDNKGKSHFPKSTLHHGFTYNVVAPPGPLDLDIAIYRGSSVLISCA